MAERVRVGVIMNGVTGRMGTNQHLVRSILAIRDEGGIDLGDGRVIWPDPILVGRNPEKVESLARRHGIERWSTDLDACLADPEDSVYFDALATRVRPRTVAAAIAAGKHVYCEKPVAPDLDSALDLARRAHAAGVKNGVVQDKLWLPGLVKLKRLVDQGFFGRLLSARIDFGYWVFPGDDVPAQRPSWNYRRADGGGIILDMFCHWRYVVDRILGPVRSVVALGATHLPERVDETGARYRADADDAAYAILTLEGGVVVQVGASWCTRVRRDDLLTVQVDGTEGSAVAGLHDCWVQPGSATPRAVWNPDLPQEHDYRQDWERVDADTAFDNAFKAQWSLFLRHVVAGDPFPWDFLEGAKGVQLAEAAERSWRERRWVDLPELSR
ncbi:MAG TPA: Gfo/Idh/MocA family oxidoreductase [Candidatus Dormibacteraeota bacterium]|nr:Gfo/Idh/MocA family oxidoreductase [Candidatus Dormibacteraeota bacterium]